MTDKKPTRKTQVKKKVEVSSNLIEIQVKTGESFFINIKNVDMIYKKDKKFMTGGYREYFSIFTSGQEIEVTEEQFLKIKKELK